jgi:2-polyprenyl-3-methyl-5-hydroxy-6-metoxy-1,4-benzoquinol methylase
VTLDTGRRAAAPHDHYSYSAYADPAMADRFEQVRFGGPIGQLLAESQERVLLDFVGPLEGRTVLDVGTGTGRAALALALHGGTVTGVDASTAMLRVARQRADTRGLGVMFAPGDAHALPFESGAFDITVCLRVLMHTPDWARCVAELCRVARHRVVLDYPALLSAAALQSGARRVAAALGAGVEAYRVLAAHAVRRELARHGFRVVAVHRQFVLPIALHKRFGSRAATERIEAGLARTGLLRLLGSPVTVMAER